MDKSKIIGILVLVMLWVWLAYAVLTASAITLKSILVVVMSGIIVFVPIWKKYLKK